MLTVEGFWKNVAAPFHFPSTKTFTALVVQFSKMSILMVFTLESVDTELL